MRHYEQVFILKPTLTAEETANRIEVIKNSITNNGGEILAFQENGTQPLAYEIENQKRGFYGVIYFTSEPSAILELERLLRISEDVLKFLTVKYESKKMINAFQKMVNKVNGVVEEKPEPEVKREATEETKAEEVPQEG